MRKSFLRVNYFSLLAGVTVRNNVQPGVENRPVDFVAVRLDADGVNAALGKDSRADEVFWLYGGPNSQALILAREDGQPDPAAARLV